jgi:hypothetical protein
MIEYVCCGCSCEALCDDKYQVCKQQIEAGASRVLGKTFQLHRACAVCCQCAESLDRFVALSNVNNEC